MSTQNGIKPRRKSLGIRRRIDIVDYYRQELVRYASASVPPDAKLLDAAAGECPDRPYFQHTRYESCDWSQNSTKSHDFLCDLRSIPVPDSNYDAIICILALDDAAQPQEWLNEFARILKPGGMLFISAPLNGRIHNPPHHYYHFSPYALRLLGENAGFEVKRMHAWGGIFGCLSHYSHSLPKYIRRQYPLAKVPAVFRYVLMVSILPFYLLFVLLFQWILPAVFFCLDRIDKERQFTLGHDCHYLKKG